MAHLLAWQADRHGIDLSPGARVRFVSRGSNLWPAGSEVETDPIAGHRDMSATECPGDAAHPLVGGELTERARTILASAQPAPTTTEPIPSTTTEPAPTTTEPEPSTSTTVAPSTTDAASAETEREAGVGGGGDGSSRDGGTGAAVPLIAGGTAAVVLAAAAGIIGIRRRTAGSTGAGSDPHDRDPARGEARRIGIDDDDDIWTV